MFPTVIEGSPENTFWPAPAGNRRARRRVPRAAVSPGPTKGFNGADLKDAKALLVELK